MLEFIIVGRSKTGEIFGGLLKDGTVTGNTGWWRTNDVKEAVISSLISANLPLELNKEVGIIESNLKGA